MRVLHVISALSGGGAEVFVKDLSTALIERKHVTAMAYISSAAEQGNSLEIERRFKDESAAAGMALYEIGHSCRRNPILGAIRLRRVIRDFKPTVLHVHLGLGIMYSSLAWNRLPTVYTHHSIKYKYGSALTWWFNRSVDAYVAICATCESMLSSKTSKPIVLIRNGISKRRVAAADTARGRGPFRVISVGRMRTVKNYTSVISIAEKLKRNHGLGPAEIEFLICGDGELLDELRQYSWQQGVEDIVHFVGGRTDVPELMAASNALLMTSIYEGMPITLIEAAHAGLPMIATAVGGIPEIVKHGINGFLYNTNDDETAADHVLTLMRDRGLWSTFSNAALETAVEFEMDRVASSHARLYERLTVGCASKIVN